MISKSLRQSLKSIKANPVRTVLTTLGIVIGIATVILVLSAGAGFHNIIDSQLATYGSNTVFIETRVPPTTKSRAASPAASGFNTAFSGVVITSLKQRDLNDIKNLNNIKNDYGIATGSTVVGYRNTEKNVIFYGAGADRFLIDQSTLKSGRFYTESEDRGALQVAILGNGLASDLFGQSDPLGQLIHVGSLNFQVVGVYNPMGSLNGGDDILYIPLITAQKKILGIDYMQLIIAEMNDSKIGNSTAAQITSLLAHNHNISDPDKNDFTVQTQEQALDTFNVIFNGLTILLIAIAAISLIVGGVGIMNIMYVTVTERTAEVGLKKALGARNADILNEFLIESVLVTILGGIIGIALGVVLSFIVYLIATAFGLEWAFKVPLYSIALGVVVSGTIGITFGVLPARSAAKMNPIEALRYE